jgi:MHS family shikimate/dehydroshikimate transporter-like MFS transporter
MNEPPSTAKAVPASRRGALAGFIGTAIETYDFFLYGTAAALVLNKLYFPTLTPFVGTLASLATYSVGFAARPIGGIVIGHFGDRIGRRSMLVLTLVSTGGATTLIGLLPTYEQIGALAPAILVLLRLVQGFAVGGEWSGAALMAVEHAPAGSRGFYGSWTQVGTPAGLLLSTAAFTLAARLPTAQFLSWGWRMPFLASIVLVAIGLVIRLRVPETPAFLRVQAERAHTRRPALDALRSHPAEVLLAIGIRIAENGAFYIYTVFVLVYATQHSGLSRQAILTAIASGAACLLFAIPLFGAMSDRVGRRPVYLLGACVTAVFAYPLLRLLDTGSAAAACLALIIALTLGHAPMYGPQAAFMSELFDTKLRYSGMSLGSQLSSVISGGLSPFVATALLPYGRGALASYIVAMAAVTIAAVLMAPETRTRDIG